MMKRFHSLTTLTALALSTYFTSAQAAQQTNTASTQDASPAPVLLPSESCPDAWRFSGTYLYMMPTLDDTFFVIDSSSSTTFPSGTRKNGNFNFHSGFRVGAEYAVCEDNRSLQAFYTRLSADQKHKVSGDFLWATQGKPDLTSSFENYAGSASSNLHLLYQRLDLNLSQQFVNAKGIYLYLQPGVELAYLRLNEHYRYHIEGTTTTGSVHQKSKVEGVGPQLGLSMDYNIYQGSYNPTVSHALTFNGLCSGSLLMSYSKAKGNQVLSDATILNVHDAKSWRMVPALHARVGLDYIVMGSSVGFSLGVAYEFNTYIRGFNRVLFVDDVADAQSFSNYNNFDVQGLSVTASLSF